MYCLETAFDPADFFFSLQARIWIFAHFTFWLMTFGRGKHQVPLGAWEREQRVLRHASPGLREQQKDGFVVRQLGVSVRLEPCMREGWLFIFFFPFYFPFSLSFGCCCSWSLWSLGKCGVRFVCFVPCLSWCLGFSNTILKRWFRWRLLATEADRCCIGFFL